MPIRSVVRPELDTAAARQAADQTKKIFATAGEQAGKDFQKGYDRAVKGYFRSQGRSLFQEQMRAQGQSGARAFGSSFGSELSNSVPIVGGFKRVMAQHQGLAAKSGAVAGRAFGLAFSTAATVGVAGLAYTLFRGFERYKALDAANQRLNNLNKTMKTLGKEAFDVQKVMQDVNDAVLGTPYALDQAFNQATKAISSGVTDVRGYLGTLADAAAFSGQSLQEIGNVFSQVLNKGKADSQDLNVQLQNLPIRAWLADTYKVTGEQLQKMIEDGQIGFEQLKYVVDKYAGGMAKTAGNTIEGAIQNMQTAIARLGANLLGAAFGQPIESGNDLRDVIETITNRLDDLNHWVNAHRDDIKEFFDGAGELASDFKNIVGEVSDALGGASDAVKTLAGAWAAAKILGWVGAFDKLKGAIWGVNGALTGSAAGGAAAGGGLIGALSALGPLWKILPLLGVGAIPDVKSPEELGLPTVTPGQPLPNGRIYSGGSFGLGPPNRVRGRNEYPTGGATLGAPPELQPPRGGDKEGKTKLPDAPQLPLHFTQLPAGTPTSIVSAQANLDEAQHDLAEKQARLQQLQEANIQDQNVLIDAQNDIEKAKQAQLEAEGRLNDAQISAMKSGIDKLTGVTDSMQEVGAKLDEDFGLSKGLPGLAENITKFLANLAFAPVFGALGGAKAALGQQSGIGVGQTGGGGLIGALGALNADYTGLNNGGYGTPGAGSGGGGGAGGPGLLSALSGLNSANPASLNIPSGSTKGGAESWRPAVRAVLRTYGPQFGITNYSAWEDALVRQIATESGGNASAVNLWDSNAQKGTPSRGLLQFIESTFNSHNVTGGNWLDPNSQIAAALSYVTSRYGMDANGAPLQIGRGVGYANGGEVVPINAHRGEHVLTRGDVKAMGGQSAVYRFRNALHYEYGGAVGRLPGQDNPQGGGLSLPGASAAAGIASAAAPALDAIAPGSSLAAQIAIQIGEQLLQRTVSYAGQLAGIGVGGLLETFTVSDDPLSDLSQSWPGRIALGVLGARPNIPNVAGALSSQATDNVINGALANIAQPALNAVGQGGPIPDSQHPGSGLPPGPQGDNPLVSIGTFNNTGNPADGQAVARDIARQVTPYTAGQVGR